MAQKNDDSDSSHMVTISSFQYKEYAKRVKMEKRDREDIEAVKIENEVKVMCARKLMEVGFPSISIKWKDTWINEGLATTFTCRIQKARLHDSEYMADFWIELESDMSKNIQIFKREESKIPHGIASSEVGAHVSCKKDWADDIYLCTYGFELIVEPLTVVSKEVGPTPLEKSSSHGKAVNHPLSIVTTIVPGKLFSDRFSFPPVLSSHSDNVPIPGPIPKGRIELICGPMFSGKTSELMRRMRCFALAKRKTIVAKYKKDNRHENSDETTLSTHDGVVHDAVSLEKDDFRRLQFGDRTGLPAFEEYGVIGVDEIQSFPCIARFAQLMAERGKIVVLAGLSGTFERVGFGEVPQLLAISEKVDVLSAVCNCCGGDAHFTKRLDKNNMELEVIGGRDEYQARCRNCFDIQ